MAILHRILLAALLLWASAGAASDLVVTVVDDHGNRVPAPYVAAIAAGARLDQPAAEKIAAGNEDVHMTVPAGEFRIVAAAPGFGNAISDPLQAGASGQSVRLILPRVGSVFGQVLAEDGKRIAHARISLMAERASDHPARLSELARQYLHERSVESDGDGYFELPVVLNRKTAAVVEADGMAPAVIADVEAGSTSLHAVRLRRGASLAVHIARKPASDARILLVPRFSPPPPLTMERALQLWRRPASQPDFPSLPSGDYEIDYLPTLSQPSAKPFAIGEVTLAPGDRKTLELAIGAGASDAQESILRFHLLGGRGESVAVEQWSGSVLRKLPVRKLETGLVEISSACKAGDRFLFTSPQAVGAAEIQSDTCAKAEPITVDLSPRAELRVRFKAPNNDALPTTGLLDLFDCLSWVSRGAIPFAVRPDGRASIAVPATCFDSRLIAGEYAPLGMPRLELPAGKVRELGERQLLRGGTILVRVDDAVDHRAAANVHVAALRASAVDNVRDPARLPLLPPLVRGVTDANGWVALSGLPDETVVLLYGREDRKLTQLSPNYRVAPGTSARAQLLLERPGTLTVTVKTADPELSVRMVEATRLLDGHSSRQSVQQLVHDGVAAFQSLEPGTWQVMAIVRTATSTLAASGQVTAEVQAGMPASATITLADRIYHGRLRRGEKPVAGLIIMRPTTGSAGPSQSVYTDDAGRFKFALPGPSEYRISVQLAPGRMIQIDRPVSFSTPEDEVVVTIPAGRIEGRVLTADGAGPAAHAGVDATRPGNDGVGSAIRAAEDGSFLLEGLSGGTWELRASTDTDASDPQVVNLREEERKSGILITLRKQRHLKGQLVGAGDVPVGGVIVSSLGATSDANGNDLTDNDGRFDLRLPSESAPPKVLMVRGQEGLSATFRIDPVDSVLLRVPSLTGGATFICASCSTHPEMLDLYWLIAPDGGAIPLSYAGGARRSTPRGLEIPVRKLAVGRWRVVREESALDRAVIADGRGLSLPPVAVADIHTGGSDIIMFENFN